MNVTRYQVEKILKTLPIGYYIKRDVKVKLTDEDGSYYDMMNDEISISYPMIERVCSNINDILENDIRCLLYHEVSHAFLTPKKLRVDDVINIFEDERIETILNNFYMNVDFKSFVKRVNNYRGENPKNGMEAFYQIVRYRVGPQYFVDRVKMLIERHKIIRDTYDYTYDVKELYRDIVRAYNVNQNQFNQFDNSQSLSASGGSQQTEAQSSENSQTIVEDQTETECFTKAEAEKIVETIVSKFDNKSVLEEIEKILSSVKKMNKQNGSAINAYSGIFNPRSVVRDDYKFFVQQNRNGHVKQFSKLHLNLFIDCSGSFRENDKAVNQLLKALVKFEKSNSDFTFDLISCSVGQEIRDKSDRIQHSSGGTLITNEIFEQYKKMQFPGTQNINIILYDGDATFQCNNRSSQLEAAKSFRAFNNKDCILIVDPENTEWVNLHCKNAKVIITDNYLKELHKNVLNALQILTR